MGVKTHLVALVAGVVLGGAIAVKLGAVDLPDAEEIQELEAELQDEEHDAPESTIPE